MRTTTKIAVLGGILLAPVLAMLPTSPASAHGYISNPPSRQAQCAAGTVECGDIKYEPQSVEGPKGLTSCSGGNSRFAELDDDSKNWQATPVGRTQTFTWSLSARHSTSTWQYFIGGTKIAEFNDGGAQPAADVYHNVNFGGFSGKQKVLAVWNVYDTAMAFYSCIDVNIGGGSDPGPGPGQCAATPWNAGSVYNGGNTVTHNGHTWRAKWWTQGETPGGGSGVWEDLGPCA